MLLSMYTDSVQMSRIRKITDLKKGTEITPAGRYLDELNERGFHDAEIARLLGVRRSAISNARSRENAIFDDEVAIKIADILELPAMLVISDLKRHSKQSLASEFWELIYLRERNKLKNG